MRGIWSGSGSGQSEQAGKPVGGLDVRQAAFGDADQNELIDQLDRHRKLFARRIAVVDPGGLALRGGIGGAPMQLAIDKADEFSNGVKLAAGRILPEDLASLAVH